MTTPNTAPSLKVLAENKTEGISKATSFRIDPNLIEFEEGFNLRTNNEDTQIHIDRIYQAMKAGAFIPPVDVAVIEGHIIARDGHCRTEAAVRLRKEVPDYTLECRQFRGNESEAVLHMLGTGSGSRPLTPLEQGAGFLRLVRYGLTIPQIAAKLGISRQTVDNGLVLAEAPVAVQDMVKAGEVSATVARDAVQQGAEGVQALTTAVVEQRKAPATKKNGKKKKVTAKTLKGTKADKKAKKKKGKGRKAAAVVTIHPNGHPAGLSAPVIETAPVDPNNIAISITRDVALATHEFIRDFGGEGNAQLISMRNTLETALL